MGRAQGVVDKKSADRNALSRTALTAYRSIYELQEKEAKAKKELADIQRSITTNETVCRNALKDLPNSGGCGTWSSYLSFTGIDKTAREAEVRLLSKAMATTTTYGWRDGQCGIELAVDGGAHAVRAISHNEFHETRKTTELQKRIGELEEKLRQKEEVEKAIQAAADAMARHRTGSTS